MPRSNRWLFSVILSSQLLAIAWGAPADSGKLPPPAAGVIDFDRDVEPILRKRCYACHGDEIEMNGYSLWERRAAIRGGHSGIPAIVPGNSAGSRLIQLVAGLEQNLVMPPGEGKLTSGEIGVLRSWIDQGVKWNSGRRGGEVQPGTPWLDMDYGSIISASIGVGRPDDPRADKKPGENISYKGIAIALTPQKDASILFDTELLRYSAGWLGDRLVLTGTVFDWKHGPHPYIEGGAIFENAVGPGWARGGSFKDPRAEEFGRLPDNWAKYRGLYIHGDKVVLSYTIGGTGVLDMPEIARSGGLQAIARTLEIEPCRRELWLQVAYAAGGNARTVSLPTKETLALLSGTTPLVAGVSGIAGRVHWDVSDGENLRLRIPASKVAQRFTIYLARAPEERLKSFAALLQQAPSGTSLAAYARGGPKRFGKSIVTQGKLGTGAGPYVVDELALPYDNPWKSWIRPGDFAFFADDRAAFTTWSGDVWIVGGLNRDLKKLTWRRYATGLHQPLGVEIVNGVVHVLGRDQITRLHDLNGDGEADFYENFNNDFLLTHHFHEFTFDLDTDREGNFYFAKAARHALPANTKHHGTILKLDKDGKNLQVVCSGFRVPNGVAIGPRGEITTSDQEGHWIPSTRIDWCSPGSFQGYMWGGSIPQGRTDYDKPIAFLPVSVDNSGAGQAFVDNDRWGPFKGLLIHSSFGRGKIFLMLMERTDGQIQGGAVELPLNFNTGLMRPEFRKQDGQLYLCGLYGWGTKRKATGGFYRVRYTGKPIYTPRELHVSREGLSITFTQPLDIGSATDSKNYYSRRWNYKWTSSYGSDLFKRNGEQGTENVPIRSASLSNGNKTVLLKMDDVSEVMQMQTGFHIKAADGTPISYDIYHTVNVVGAQWGKPLIVDYKR